MDSNNNQNRKELSRRNFLGMTTAAAAAITIVPRHVLGGRGFKAPSDILNVALVGAGSQGSSDILNICKAVNAAPPRGTMKSGTENLVAVCDVDWGYSKVQETFGKYPAAKQYKDWRVMYDEMGKSIDAVVIATADHNHANPTATAITLGKHVYCEKPLTHTIYESRLLTKLTEKYGVATQMGNQGSSNPSVRQACAWAWAGEIGEVRRVDAWSARPIWPQGLDTPTDIQKVPKTLDWNLWLGHMPFRAYNSAYTPWNFRGWWDFGTGAFGDMACHNMHPVFKVLKLGSPIRVQGQSSQLKIDSCPNAQMVKMTFPAHPNLPNLAMPEVEVTWYDGGLHGMIPEIKLPEGKRWQAEGCAMSVTPFQALACPLDGTPLHCTGSTWNCAAGHSFDIASQGYTNLLPVQHKRSRDPGDSKEMVAARRRFLTAGFYQPIAAAVTRAVLAGLPANGSSSCLDAGCGEGYYLRQLASAVPEEQTLALVGLEML